MVRQEHSKWFGHLERISKDDWVAAYGVTWVACAKGRGRDRKTGEELVKHDLKSQGLEKELAQDKST